MLCFYSSKLWLCSAGCPLGYNGRECAYSCTYPYYGKDCLYKCDCTEEQCNFVNGCKTTSKASKYIHFYIFKNEVHCNYFMTPIHARGFEKMIKVIYLTKFLTIYSHKLASVLCDYAFGCTVYSRASKCIFLRVLSKDFLNS